MTTRFRRATRCAIGMSSTDFAFDALVPLELRHLSATHWTPIEVVLRVSKLLSPSRDTRILDIGAGIGKVCSVGALSSLATWFGIERHELLAMTAERLARGLGVGDRTRFFHGDAFSLDWTDFDALYLYNPFELPLAPDASGPDHVLGYRAQVSQVEERLGLMREGSRIVTFNGFGGVMPASYDLACQERVPSVGLDLVLWVQRARPARAPVPS